MLDNILSPSCAPRYARVSCSQGADANNNRYQTRSAPSPRLPLQCGCVRFPLPRWKCLDFLLFTDSIYSSQHWVSLSHSVLIACLLFFYFFFLSMSSLAKVVRRSQVLPVMSWPASLTHNNKCCLAQPLSCV